MGKPSKCETFNDSGPITFTSMDWNKFYHRTLVTSCLVQGVYSLEDDRQQNLSGHNSSHATPWWEHFHFTLLRTLIDESDDSIYGAIFKYTPNSNDQNTPPLTPPPRYVIAFRGTVLEPDTMFRDIKLDLLCVFYTLHRSSRFKHAVQSIQKFVENHKNEVVWLAGHSLGAGIALLAGKTMARLGFPLESYIFNPPISSIPLEKLFDSEKCKYMFRLVGSVFKAGVAAATEHHHSRNEAEEKESLVKLASWKPYLYVNPEDLICSEYIGYFKYKSKMSKFKADKLESYATRHSIRSHLFRRKETSSSTVAADLSGEPIHYLPSAYMTVNTDTLSDLKSAHGIRQWWDPKFNVKPVLYQFKS